MGKKVNVVLWDGRVVSVDENQAKQIGRTESSEEALASGAEAALEQNTTFGDKARATVEGGLDTVSGGAYGYAVRKLGSDESRFEMQRAAQAAPGYRFAGEAAALVAPTGWLGRGAKAAGDISVVGGLSRAGHGLTEALGGGRIAKVAGRTLEGAGFGITGQIASSNVTGDPLTIEGTVEAAGVGGIVNVGFGLLGDGLIGAGKSAKTALTKTRSIEQNVQVAKEGRQLFESPPDSWQPFVESVEAKWAAQNEVVRTAEKAQKTYTDWLTDRNLDSSLKTAEKARNEVLARINKTQYGQEAVAARDAAKEAQKVYQQTQKKAETLLNDTEKWPVKMRMIDSAIEQVAARPGYAENADTQALLKSFKDRASEIRRIKVGGYRTEAGKWIKDASVAADPMRALEELNKLRDEFTTKYSGVKFPNIPRAPQLPEGFKLPPATGDLTEVKQLSAAARELTGGIDAARGRFRAGDFEGAAGELRQLRARAQSAGINDLVLPTVPEAPPISSVVPDIEKLDMPRDLRELARKKPETIERIANFMADDPAAKEAFNRLAGDLGLDPRHGLAGLHSKLTPYIKAVEELKVAAAKEAEEEAQGGLLHLLKKAAKGGVRYGVARVADTMLGGGFAGAAARVVAGEATAAAMTRFEDAVGGQLLAGKQGVTRKVSELVEKYAGKAGTGINKFGPVTSNLSTQFLGTEQDKEKDPRKQAVNRINEIIAKRIAAPDALFVGLQALLGHPSDAAWKVHSHILNALDVLTSTTPKDPGTAATMTGSDWTPSWQDTLALAHRIEAVTDPMRSIARSIAGDGHPAATETLWAVWPNMMAEAAQEIAFSAPQMKGLTYEQASGFSQLFRTPLTGLQEPTIVAAIQGLYLPKPNEAPGQAPSRATGNPNGRPPAVDSRVAGSSVSKLIA